MIFINETTIKIASGIFFVTMIFFCFLLLYYKKKRQMVREPPPEDIYDPDRYTFVPTKNKIWLLIYKQPRNVDVVPFDTGEAATEWGLMIVRNSREIWKAPHHKTDLELLVNWTTVTKGTEFIVRMQIPIRTLAIKE